MDAHVIIERGPHALAVAGAGILLYMARHTPRGPEVMFVLAQEDYVDGWNQSGCWSAFEGGRHPGETCEQTAAREFHEETMGAIDINGVRGASRIAAMLAGGGFVTRVCIERERSKRAHMTYLVRIPWGTPVVAMFDAARAPLQRVRELCCGVDIIADRLAAGGAGGAAPGPGSAGRMGERRDAALAALEDLGPTLRSHEAVVIRKEPGSRAPAALRPEYMEKRRVALVPVHEIRDALRPARYAYARSRASRLPLRYTFVPVIKAVLTELASAAHASPAR